MKKKLLSLLLMLAVGIGSAWADYTSGSTVAAGDYFLYNIGAKKFFTNGMAWGAYASVDNAGRVVTLAASTTGDGAYTLYTKNYGSTDAAGYLGKSTDLYLDCGTDRMGSWTFNSVNVDGYTNAYTISSDSKYLYYANDGNVQAGETASSNEYYWILIPKSDRDAAGDLTYVLQNTDFNRPWERPIWNGASKAKSDTDLTLTADGVGGLASNRNQEFFNKNFDMYQSISSVPNGKWKMTCQGYYRGANADSKNALMYINNTTSPLKNVLEEGKDAADSDNGFTTENTGKYIPNSQDDASKAFTAGYYNNEMTAYVTTGAIQVGVKKETLVEYDWTVVDNFTLTLVESAIENYATIATSPVTAAADTWYKIDIANAGTYNVTTTDGATILYTQTGSNIASDVTISASNGGELTLTAGTLYIKASAASTVTISASSISGAATAFTSGASADANKWYSMDVTAGTYTVYTDGTATISYTQDGTQGTSSPTTTNVSSGSEITLSAGTLYFTATSASTVAIDQKITAIETVGTRTDLGVCAGTYDTDKSNVYTLADGGSYHFVFKNYNNYPSKGIYDQTTNPSGTGNWNNWILMCTNGAETPTKYFALRNDFYNDVATNNVGCSANFSWDTFLKDMNGATVDMTVTHNANKIAVTSTITTTGGKTYNYSFKYNNVTTSPVGLYFTVNISCIKLITADYTAPTTTSNTIYEMALGDWNSEVYGNTGLWKCTAGTASTSTDNGLEVSAEKASAAITGTITHTTNSILTIDAVWNTGSAYSSSDDYTYFNIGNDIQIKCVPQDQKAYTIINGTSTVIANACVKDQNRDQDVYTIHAEINTALNTLTSLTIVGSKGTNKVDLSMSNVGLSSSATYDTYSIGENRSKCSSKSFTYLNSIKISEEQQTITTANYTVKYVCGDTEVKTADTRTGEVDAAITLTATDIANFYTTDNTKKYIYVSNDSESKTIASDGSTVVTVTFREAAKYNWTAKSSVGSLDLGSGTTFEGDAVSVAYPKYVNVDGTLYTKDANNKEYKATFTPDQDNYEYKAEYTATDITGVVYFSEAENITGATATDAGTNMKTRSSNAKCGYAASDITLINLPAGSYKATSVQYSNSSSGTTLKYQAGDQDAIENKTTAASNWYEFTNDFTLTAAADFKWLTSGDDKNALDFIYIQKLQEVAKAGDYSAPSDATAAASVDAAIVSKNMKVANDVNACVSLPDGAKSSCVNIALKSASNESGSTVVTKMSFDIKPQYVDAEGVTQTIANSSISKAITFRLPVDANATFEYANVKHESDAAVCYKVLGDATNGKYIEVSAKSFSTFSYDLTNTATAASSANLKGYKTFYNATKAYEADENTTIYTVATAPTAGATTINITAQTADKIIPAGTPVILKTTASDYKITLTPTETTTSSNDYTNNALKAAASAGAISDAYILAYTTAKGLGFYKYTGNFTVGQVYVTVPASEARMFNIVVDEETAINNVEENTTATPVKYIENGKLYIKTANGTYNTVGARVK